MARNLALIFTPMLFWLAVRAVQAWRNHSPAGAENAAVEPKAQVKADTPARPPRGRGVADTPPRAQDLAAVARWADLALRKIGRGR